MDILYQLPFPHEVCSKIFMYSCKSPHTGLGVAILKKIIGLSIYNKLIGYEEDDVNVMEFRVWKQGEGWILNHAELRELTFDIDHLKSLPNLTVIDLENTGVSGNIAHLKSLLNLTRIFLYNTGVSGNIAHLKSLPKLSEIGFNNTGVSGNIEHLKSLPKLNMIYLDGTDVSGDKEAFVNNRKSAGLPYFIVEL